MFFLVFFYKIRCYHFDTGILNIYISRYCTSLDLHVDFSHCITGNTKNCAWLLMYGHDCIHNTLDYVHLYILHNCFMVTLDQLEFHLLLLTSTKIPVHVTTVDNRYIYMYMCT